MWGNSSWPLPFGHGVLPASAPDLGRGVAPLGLALARPSQPPALFFYIIKTTVQNLLRYSNTWSLFKEHLHLEKILRRIYNFLRFYTKHKHYLFFYIYF